MVFRLGRLGVSTGLYDVIMRLFCIYMNIVAREVGATVLGRGVNLSDERYETDQLSFPDNTAPMINSGGMLCRLVNEFGTVFGLKKVIHGSWYGNASRIYVRLTCRLLEKVNCFNAVECVG